MQNGTVDRTRTTREKYDAPKIVVLGNAAELTLGTRGEYMEFIDSASWTQS